MTVWEALCPLITHVYKPEAVSYSGELGSQHAEKGGGGGGGGGACQLKWQREQGDVGCESDSSTKQVSRGSATSRLLVHQSICAGSAGIRITVNHAEPLHLSSRFK